MEIIPDYDVKGGRSDELSWCWELSQSLAYIKARRRDKSAGGRRCRSARETESRSRNGGNICQQSSGSEGAEFNRA